MRIIRKNHDENFFFSFVKGKKKNDLFPRSMIDGKNPSPYICYNNNNNNYLSSNYVLYVMYNTYSIVHVQVVVVGEVHAPSDANLRKESRNKTSKHWRSDVRSDPSRLYIHMCIHAPVYAEGGLNFLERQKCKNKASFLCMICTVHTYNTIHTPYITMYVCSTFSLLIIYNETLCPMEKSYSNYVHSYGRW